MTAPAEATRRVMAGASVAMFLRCLNAGLGFGTTIVLARLLTPAQFGVYASAVALSTIVATPMSLGAGPAGLRAVGRAIVSGDWSTVAGLLRASTRAVALIATGSALVAWVLVLVVRGHADAATFGFSLATVPFFALAAVRQGYMQGLGDVFRALAPEFMVRPVATLALVLAAAWFLDLSSTLAVAAFLLAGVISTAVGWYWLHLKRPSGWIEATPAPTPLRQLWRAGLPLTLFASLTVLDGQLGTLVLGLRHEGAEAAKFAIAARCVDILAFTVVALNTVSAPHFAKTFAQPDLEDSRHHARRVWMFMMATTVPLGLFLLIFGHPVMAFFGSDYVAAVPALRVLSITQILIALAGPVTVVLVMSGHERLAVRAMLAGVTVNVVCSLALTPAWGALGAATGRGLGTVVWIAAMWVWSRRVLTGAIRVAT